MKFHKELIPWILILTIAAIGFFLLLAFTPVLPEEGERSASSLFLAGPAYCATLALASFFIISRFFTPRKGHPVSRTRFKHVFVSSILALAGIITWEFSQMFIIERPFAFPSLLGALGGCLTMVLMWLFIKIKMQQTNHPPLS